MSNNGYNHLFEFNEEAKSNYSNNYRQINNNYNSQKNINLNNFDLNFNNSTKYDERKTKTLLEDDYNLISSEFKGNNIQGNRQKIPIKWRNVMKIDIDAIRNTNDLSLLSSFLENFLYSTINEDDLQAVPEENIVKLIKILQFSIEYLLSSRQNLNENIINLQGQKQGLIVEEQKLDKNIKNQKEYVDKADKEKKERIKEIAYYKNIVSSLVEGDIPISGIGGYTKITDINVDINKNYNYNQSKLRGYMNGYKCKYCTGKIFSSEFELKKHLTDIHLIEQFPDEKYNINHNIKPQQTASEINITVPPLNNNNLNNNNRELEKKLNEMRMEMQEYIHKTEINELKNQIKNQKNYKNEGPDYKQEIEKMGNTFNDTLKQVLGIMIKNNNNQEKQKIIINQKSNNFEKDLKNDEEINNLKKRINETKSIYERKRKEYDEKIYNLKNEINILKNQKMEVNIDINKKKDIVPKNIILVPEQKEPISYLKKNIKKLGKISKFHSGFLESDHDDSDNERKRKEKIIRQIEEKTELYEIIIKENKIINEKEEDDNNNNLRMKNFLDGKDLDDFYKRYIKRDNKYLQNSQFKNYLKKVLPDEFSQKKVIENRAEIDINEKIKKTARILRKENEFEEPIIEVKDFKKENTDDLLKLINNTFSKMELLNDNNDGITDPYYKSLEELLDLPDIKKTCEDFAKLYNVNINENIKSNKLRAVNKKNLYNDNNRLKNMEYDIKNNNIPKEDEEYGDIEYFSGGNALSSQKNEIINNNIDLLKNANSTSNSNLFNYTQNQNQFINANNNIAQNTNYSSFRNGPFPNNTLYQNQNEKKEEENQPFSSAIEGRGFIRDNNKEGIEVKLGNYNVEDSKASIKPLENNNINEEEAK